MSSEKTAGLAGPYGPVRESRPLVPGFDATLDPIRTEYEEMEETKDKIRQARRLVKLLSKAGSIDLWENNPGGSKSYPEGSGRDLKDKRTGINMAWERNESVDPGSDEPVPPLLNQDGGAQP